MARPGAAADLTLKSIRGIGDTNKEKTARLSLPVGGIGQPTVTEVLAANGAAGVAVDISIYRGKVIRFSAGGDVLVRFSIDAATVVTATQWHEAVQAGTGFSKFIPYGITHVSAWGVLGACSCVLYTHDEVD